jgi:hypothetical protein
MNNPDHISESLETIVWVKILKFFDADPEIRDPEIRGSGIRRSGIRRSGIRDGKIWIQVEKVRILIRNTAEVNGLFVSIVDFLLMEEAGSL